MRLLEHCVWTVGDDDADGGDAHRSKRDKLGQAVCLDGRGRVRGHAVPRVERLARVVVGVVSS